MENQTKIAAHLPDLLDIISQPGAVGLSEMVDWSEVEPQVTAMAKAKGLDYDTLGPEEQREFDELIILPIIQKRYEDVERLFNGTAPITVYRALTLPEGIEATQPQGFGVHWSWDESGAFPYCGNSKEPTYIFRGEVDKQHINWSETAYCNVVNDLEKEIRLYADTQVKVTGWKKCDDAEWQPPQEKFRTVLAATRPQWKRWQEEDGRWDNTLMNRLKKFYRKGFPLTVYRAIDLAEGQTPNLRGFGKHWTWDEKSAKRYSPADWGSSEFSGLPKHTYIFKGIIHDKNSVNWRETLGYNDYCPDEREIQLNSGAEIEIVGYRRIDEKEWKTPAFKTVTASRRVTEVPQFLYHGTFWPNYESIMQHGLGGKVTQKAWSFSTDGLVYMVADADEAEIFAEGSEEVSQDWLDAIIVLQIDASQLDVKKLFVDDTEYTYAGVVPPSAISLYREAKPNRFASQNTVLPETGLRRQPDYMEPGSYSVKMNEENSKEANVAGKIKAYHLSPNKIDSFFPFSHFGSLNAARDRGREGFQLKQPYVSSPLTIYEVELDINNPLTVPDLKVGDSTARHSWLKLADQLYYDLKVIQSSERDDVIRTGQSMGDTAGYFELKNILEKYGYDGLVYINKFEDPGSLSYVILDSHQARIIDEFPLTPSKRASEQSNQDIIKEIDQKFKVDKFFNDHVGERRKNQVRVAIAYLKGAKPIAEYSDGKYRCVIMDSEYDFYELTFKEGDPHPVPSGKWMNYPEKHWFPKALWKNEEEILRLWKNMPFEERARMECKEQVEKWIPKQYEKHKFEFYHPRESERESLQGCTLYKKGTVSGEGDFVYHGTSARNIPAIKSEGLTPLAPDHEGWPEFDDEEDDARSKEAFEPRIFATSSFDSAKEYADNHGDGVVLRLPLSLGWGTGATDFPYWYLTKPIPPSSIDIWSSEGWRPLLDNHIAATKESLLDSLNALRPVFAKAAQDAVEWGTEKEGEGLCYYIAASILEAALSVNPKLEPRSRPRLPLDK
jgi:hypothetical protein